MRAKARKILAIYFADSESLFDCAEKLYKTRDLSPLQSDLYEIRHKYILIIKQEKSIKIDGARVISKIRYAFLLEHARLIAEAHAIELIGKAAVKGS